MLQHWAALCQPTHARLAHFVASTRSQFSSRAAVWLCACSGTTRLVGVST